MNITWSSKRTIIAVARKVDSILVTDRFKHSELSCLPWNL